MSVAKPLVRSKVRPPKAGHPWKAGSFERMQAQRERLNKLAEIRRREREQE